MSERVRRFHHAWKKRLAGILCERGVSIPPGDIEEAPFDPEIAWLVLVGLTSTRPPSPERLIRGRHLLRADSLPRLSPSYLPRTSGPPPEWIESTLNRVNHEIRSDTGNDPGIRPGNPLAYEARADTESALEWMKHVWPEARGEIQCAVQKIVWFRSPCFWSTTAPYAYGSIFMNPARHWSVPHFFDTLLHESGHLLIMAEQSATPLMSAPDAKGASPLREDPRPMMGIYHATWVLQRICEGLERYLDAANSPQKDQAIQLLGDYRPRIEPGLKLLAERAGLTGRGSELLGQTCLG